VSEPKKKVYVETSVVSVLTARPSHNLVDAARQVQTIAWWTDATDRFALYGSQVLTDEISDGDPMAASQRLALAKEFVDLQVDERMFALATKFLEATAVPKKSFDDAMHIATAAVHGMDYLVTWNCKHIANVYTKPIIARVCNECGYQCPCICTPPEMEGGPENV